MSELVRSLMHETAVRQLRAAEVKRRTTDTQDLMWAHRENRVLFAEMNRQWNEALETFWRRQVDRYAP